MLFAEANATSITQVAKLFLLLQTQLLFQSLNNYDFNWYAYLIKNIYRSLFSVWTIYDENWQQLLHFKTLVDTIQRARLRPTGRGGIYHAYCLAVTS